MKIKRLANTKRNIVLGMTNKISKLVLQFVIRTILIKKLGIEYGGLSSLFTSVLSMLSLMELGFSSAVVFNMYKAVASDDTDTICGLLSYYRRIYLIIGSLIMAVGLILTPFIPFLVKGSTPSDVNIYLLYIIYLANTGLSYFLFAYTISIFDANQRNDVGYLNNIIATILSCGLQIIALMLGANYYVYALLLLVATVVYNLLNFLCLKRQYPNYKCKGTISTELKKSLKTNITALFGHKVGSVVVSNYSTVIVSAILGLVSVTIFSNYMYLVQSVSVFLTVVYTATTAGIGNSIVTDSIEKNYNNFLTYNFINNWLVCWCTACFLVLFQPVMLIWMGDELMLPFFSVILFVVYFYIHNIRQTVLTYKDAAGIWNEDKLKPYIEAAIDIVLGLIFTKIWGINGILLTLIISMLFVVLPWETNALYKTYFKVSQKKYYLINLISLLITIVVSAVTFYLAKFIPYQGYLGIGLKLIFCIFIPNILFLLLMLWNKELKNALLIIKKMIFKN